MADFTSFEGVATYLEVSEKRFKQVQKKGLQAVGKHVRDAVRAKHGRRQPGWAVSKSNPSSPLLRTGELRSAAVYRTKSNYVSIFSKKEWLAVIHEFGVTYKMTDKQRKFLFANVFEKSSKPVGRPRKTWGSGMIRIPPRPIWRRVLKEEAYNVYAIIDKHLSTVFP